MSGMNFNTDLTVLDMEDEAAEEEAKDKEAKAGMVKEALRRRMGSNAEGGIGGMGGGKDGTRSAPSEAQQLIGREPR